MQMSLGKGVNQDRAKNSNKAVVLDLIQPLKGSGRNITCDNWFTFISIGR